MCGLCGVISPNLTAVQVSAFKDLLAVSVLRGDNGAGVVKVPIAHDKPPEILRMAGLTSSELAYGIEFFNLMKSNGTVLMGHARQPTSGGYDEADCHPHKSGNILGMHNGTMHSVMNRKVGKNDNDSVLLFKAISEHGIEKTIQNSDGAFALTYLDTKADTIYFLRNAERPLFWATVKGEHVLYWASERGFLDLVLSRVYKKEFKIYGLVPMTLVSFCCHPLSKVAYIEAKKITDKPTTSIVPFVPQKTPPFTPDKKDVVMLQTAQGFFHSFEDLRIILAAGCAYCKQSATIQDYQKKDMYWIAGEEFVCSECVLTDQLARDYVASHNLPIRHFN